RGPRPARAGGGQQRLLRARRRGLGGPAPPPLARVPERALGGAAGGGGRGPVGGERAAEPGVAAGVGAAPEAVTRALPRSASPRLVSPRPAAPRRPRTAPRRRRAASGCRRASASNKSALDKREGVPILYAVSCQRCDYPSRASSTSRPGAAGAKAPAAPSSS